MDLIDFVRGGLDNSRHEQVCCAIPAEFFEYPDDLAPSARHELTYRRLRRAGLTAPAAGELLADPPLLCALLERAAVADPALFHLMLLHYTLVLAPIVHFGDTNTAAIQRELTAMQSFGVVAMTEAGRSNSHLAPATIARFEPQSRNFVLSTPTPAAKKFPTTAGHPGTPKTAVVYAQLVVGDQRCGVFIFVVPLRDESGATTEGVRIVPAPNGHALPIDCAAIEFNELRLPYSAWLAAGARITPDGTFHDPNPRARLSLSMYAAPTVWRAVISASAAISRAAGVVLLRHSVNRVTMGKLAPGYPLLGMRNQQDAVLTALSRAYALTAMANHVKHRSTVDNAPAPNSAWTPWAAVDVTLPLLKSAATTTAEETVALCRLHCGAAGFTATDQLNGYRSLLHGYRTAAGDNQLINYDTARAMVEESGYQPPAEDDGPFELSFDGCLRAARNLERRLQRRLTERIAALDPFTAWNANFRLAEHTATAFADRAMLEILEREQPSLHPLWHWLGLDWAERRAVLLLDQAATSGPLLDQIEKLRTDLREQLMPRAAELAAACELPELEHPPFWDI
ncbi:hypothetical protein IU427_32625 [Nocardia beijingensis]|uniref:acyl-CoA dehydrogenase family protein n=1 Tax=Nocardia beijingensis TaxID=95162 RepID=UPI0018931D38|nr:hypothetical protein [Nocardia beijingensis]MBF6469872.1 hypothetical protein [Nocardia beijingensis]